MWRIFFLGGSHLFNDSFFIFKEKIIKKNYYRQVQVIIVILDKTSKFDWMPDSIRTEKIISTPIWAC